MSDENVDNGEIEIPEPEGLAALSDEALLDLVRGVAPSESEAPPAEETPAETEKSVEPEAPVEAEEKEPTELDVLRLQMQKIQEDAQHWKMAHDKLTGEYGRLKQQKPAGADPAAHSAYDDDAMEAVKRELEAVKNELSGVRKDRATHAVAAEADALQREHPDSLKLAEDMKAFLGANADLSGRWKEALETDDPDRARTLARDVLRSAYFGAAEKALQARLEKANKARTEKSDALRTRKLEAAPSASGSARPPTPRRVVKNVSELSDDELLRAVRSTSR